jgi:hypothetical protein
VSRHASDDRWWRLELAPSWIVMPSAAAPERAPLQEDDCVAIVPPTRDATLRVFARDLSTHDPSPSAWVEACAQISARRGWLPEPWAADGFVGAHARQSAGAHWWHIWWLAAGAVGLNALYRCPQEIAGRDDLDLASMLRTLELRAPAG